eukprot:642524-Hanusia_phi.AAC.2
MGNLSTDQYTGRYEVRPDNTRNDNRRTKQRRQVTDYGIVGKERNKCTSRKSSTWAEENEDEWEVRKLSERISQSILSEEEQKKESRQLEGTKTTRGRGGFLTFGRS